MTNSDISKEDLARLYWARWDLEEQFKLTKIGLKLEDFKSKHINGVLQEIWTTQAQSSICRSFSICTNGPKLKKRIQKSHSTLGIAKLLKASKLRIFFCLKSKLKRLTDWVKRGLKNF